MGKTGSINAKGYKVVAFECTRLDAERVRIAEMMARAAVPEACGPEIPVAPARGPRVQVVLRKMMRTKSGGYVVRRSGHEGRAGLRCADVFDLMGDAARKAHQREARRIEAAGDDAPDFRPPFTPGQISVARDYAALVERVAAAGVSCSSLEALRQKAGTGGDRELAIFLDFQRLRAMQHRIGDGLVKEVRRIRPDGQRRRAIRARVLVDMVCLGQRSLAEVLRVHGWRVNGRSVAALQAGLRAALDRMQGYL